MRGPSQRQKRILKWAGYPLLALITFVFTAHWTFPYERVKDRFIVEPLSDKFEVTVLSTERTFWPGGMVLKGVALRSRPTKEDEKPTTIFIDEVEIDLGLLALLRGRAELDVVAAIGGGTINANIEASKTSIRAKVATSSLPLSNIPGLREAVGLPMKGGLNADIDVVLPEGRWDKADGAITLFCPNCTIGDGKTKIKPRPRPGRRVRRNAAIFASDGLTVPELKLGEKFGGTMKLAGGRGTIENFTADSADGEMAIQATVRFGRKFKDSSFESGCMKFKLSNKLKQREPKFGNLPDLMRISPQPDGFSNVKLRGKLVTMRWVPTKKCDAGDSVQDRRDKRRSPRPTISTRPDDDDKKPTSRSDGDELPRPSVKAAADEAPTQARDGGVALPGPRTSGPPLSRGKDDVRPGKPMAGGSAVAKPTGVLRPVPSASVTGDEDEGEEEEGDGDGGGDDDDDDDDDEGDNADNGADQGDNAADDRPAQGEEDYDR